MKRLLKIILGLIFVMVLGGVGFYIFLITQKDESKTAKHIVLSSSESEEGVLVKSGRFIYIDSLHNATGTVSVYDLGDKYKISLSNDFLSADAPDPYIYLSSEDDIKDKVIGGVDTKKALTVEKLKSFEGAQDYFVSKSDFDSHNMSVIVWCKKYGVQISRADLN